MLNIEKAFDGSKLRVTLDGRLDTLSSPNLERELESVIHDVTELVFDLEKLQYVSSAGLRVLLDAAQIMEEQGESLASDRWTAILPFVQHMEDRGV